MDTTLNIEGKCLLKMEVQDTKVNFYCDGYNVLDSLFLLPDLGEINIKKLLFEFGIGETYKSITINDLKNMYTFSDLKKRISEFQKEVFIYDLDLSSENLEISIHDDRDFNFISFDDEIYCKNIITNLIASSFNFSTSISNNIYSALKYYDAMYVEINPKGDIVANYLTFEEYLNK